MMMGCRERIITRSPFTPSQWEELEQQALVYKYMVSGSPIPQDLISTVQRSLESSLSSDLLLHQLGWGNGYRMAGGFGLRKIDPEPGRCRRTDGKKWRCSKEAYPDSKYCERHMHRGRNRSRKPVEIQSPSSPPSAAATDKPGDILPVTRNTLSSWPSETSFIHSPHFSAAQESSNTRLFLESHGFTLSANKAYRKQMGDGMKGAADNEHAFLSMKTEAYYSSGLENERQKTDEHNCCNNRDVNLLGINIGRENDQPKKVMHHFLDESPPKEGKSFSNWPINESELKFSVDNRNNTQLPMTVVPTNSLHDFFMTQKW